MGGSKMKTVMPGVTRNVLLAQSTDGDGFLWKKQARQVCQKFRHTTLSLFQVAAAIFFADDKQRAELEAQKAYSAFMSTRDTPRKKGRRRNQEPAIPVFVRALIAVLVCWKKPVVSGRFVPSVA